MFRGPGQPRTLLSVTRHGCISPGPIGTVRMRAHAHIFTRRPSDMRKHSCVSVVGNNVTHVCCDLMTDMMEEG